MRELREERGIKQASLARALGIPPQTLANYELGPNRFPAELLPRVAVALNATYEELLGGVGEAAPKLPANTSLTHRERTAAGILNHLTQRLTPAELELLDAFAEDLVRMRARLRAEEHDAGTPLALPAADPGTLADLLER